MRSCLRSSEAGSLSGFLRVAAIPSQKAGGRTLWASEMAVSRWFFNFVFSGLDKPNCLDGHEAPDKKVDAQQTGNDRLGCSVGECCVSVARLSQSACWKMSVHRELH